MVFGDMKRYFIMRLSLTLQDQGSWDVSNENQFITFKLTMYVQSATRPKEHSIKCTIGQHRLSKQKKNLSRKNDRDLALINDPKITVK